jgi:hypothetical protein
MYFFDIEDYRTSGFFGRNYSGMTVDTLPWEDAYNSFRAVKDYHYNKVNQYFMASINMVEVSNRLDIFNANKTFCEKAGLLAVKELEFWQMMLSYKYDKLRDNDVISYGTIISVKHESNLSDEEKANGFLFKYNDWSNAMNPNQNAFVYAFIQPEGTPTNLTGNTNFYNSIESGDLFTIKYTQFDVNIYNDYKTALQELMAAEKAFIESIDGVQTIID